MRRRAIGKAHMDGGWRQYYLRALRPGARFWPVPVQLEIKALVNYRDFHSTTHAAQLGDRGRFQIAPVDHGLHVIAGPGRDAVLSIE